MTSKLDWQEFASRTRVGVAYRRISFHQMPDRAALYASDPDGLAAMLDSHAEPEASWRIITVNADGKPVEPQWTGLDIDANGAPVPADPKLAEYTALRIANLAVVGAALVACDGRRRRFFVVPDEATYRLNPSLNRSLVLVLSEPFRVLPVPLLFGEGGALEPDTDTVAEMCRR